MVILATPSSLLAVRLDVGLSTSAVREFANKSAASAASPGYVKFQAVIKSAASAASLRGGRASGRLDHVFFFVAFFGRASGQKMAKISDSVSEWTTLHLEEHHRAASPAGFSGRDQVGC